MLPLEGATTSPTWTLVLALVTATIAVASLVVTYFSNRSNRRSTEAQAEKNRAHAAEEAFKNREAAGLEAERNRASAAAEANKNRHHAAVEADKNRREAAEEAHTARLFARRADTYDEALITMADALAALLDDVTDPQARRTRYQKYLFRLGGVSARMVLFGTKRSRQIWGKFDSSMAAALDGPGSREDGTDEIYALHKEFAISVNDDLLSQD